MDKTAEVLFEYLKNILYYPAAARLDVESLPPDFRKLGEGMQFLADCVQEERAFMNALANGNLSVEPPGAENVLASPGKALQAALRHLQWQTKRVADGDYSQRVEFMGEFSEAFNTMTAQLAKRREDLIEEKKLVEELVYDLAYIDPLTHLKNRRYAMNRMENWMKEGVPFLVSYIDIDYLKYCNDTFGHEIGDQYLIAAADLLTTMPGEFCRIGGDEFLILASGTDEKIQDEQLLRLREQFSQKNDQTPPYIRGFSFATTAVPALPEKSLTEYLTIVDEKMRKYKTENKKPLKDLNYKDDRI